MAGLFHYLNFWMQWYAFNMTGKGCLNNVP
jgi:hypothetical protein